MGTAALVAMTLAAAVLPGSNCVPDSVIWEMKYPVVHSLSVTAGLDYVANSTENEVTEPVPSEQRISIHSALPVTLRYSFSFTDSRIRHYLPGGYQGLAVGLPNFGAGEPGGFNKSRYNIGYPVSVYIFQGGPFWHHNTLSLAYEWNFGASFGWKPYSASNRCFNLAVGSHVNAYLNLGLFLQWQLNPNVSLFGGLEASHFSNGNTSFPNPGINMLGARLGVSYTLNPPHKGFPPAQPDTTAKKRLGYDISLWGASRKRVYKGGDKPVLLPGHFACAGISFAPMVRFGNWWRLGGSLDLQWDQSSDLKKNYIGGDTTEDIEFNHPDFFRQITVGLSAHGELRMPIFALNIGIGYNLVAPWENRGTYQNITLKTYFCEKLFLNVGYQLRNFHQQSSLMLGLGLTL